MIEIFKKLEKYNYWNKKTYKIGFYRIKYLEKIKKYCNNDLIKVIIGQRRVGKSYILRQIIYSLLKTKINPKNIFYLNKELTDFDDIKNYKDLSKLIQYYKKQLRISGKVYIFLDEVQEIVGWEKIVNSLSQDCKDSYEVYITGSNSAMLSSELGTYLSGRFITFEIFPYSFNEYASFFNHEKNKINFINFLKIGGLPELFNLNDNETRFHYITALKDTIILNDIVKKFTIRDVYLLERLFMFLIDNIGNIFSINKIVNYLKNKKINTNYETLSNYMSYLCNSNMVHAVDRYDIKGKEILSGNKKYYLNDLSFRNYLCSGFDPGMGKSLENYFYLYFRSLGYKIYIGNIQKEEVDFILENGDKKKYYQITYSLLNKDVVDREFRSLEKIRDSYEKYVISLDDTSFGNRNGIKHLLAWEI